jgi:lysophospholipase L1-like esterase
VGDARFPDGSTKPDTQNPGGTLADGGTGASDALSTDGYCPATEPCRISPLGDSITEGMGWNYPTGGGYRSKLFSLALKEAKNITFVGTRSNGPNTVDGKPFPKNHEGTSGITIQNLQSVVDKGALTGSAVKPHIILIHLGTNNLSSGTATSNAALLDSFLGSVIKNAPQALLVVAQIIPFNGSEKGFNAAIPAIVDKRAKEGAHIIMVDQSAGFTSADIADGVHPNEGGYAKMAAVWYKAIAQHLH